MHTRKRGSSLHTILLYTTFLVVPVDGRICCCCSLHHVIIYISSRTTLLCFHCRFLLAMYILPVIPDLYMSPYVICAMWCLDLMMMMMMMLCSKKQTNTGRLRFRFRLHRRPHVLPARRHRTRPGMHRHRPLRGRLLRPRRRRRPGEQRHHRRRRRFG